MYTERIQTNAYSFTHSLSPQLSPFAPVKPPPPLPPPQHTTAPAAPAIVRTASGNAINVVSSHPHPPHPLDRVWVDASISTAKKWIAEQEKRQRELLASRITPLNAVAIPFGGSISSNDSIALTPTAAAAVAGSGGGGGLGSGSFAPSPYSARHARRARPRARAGALLPSATADDEDEWGWSTAGDDASADSAAGDHEDDSNTAPGSGGGDEWVVVSSAVSTPSYAPTVPLDFISQWERRAAYCIAKRDDTGHVQVLTLVQNHFASLFYAPVWKRSTATTAPTAMMYHPIATTIPQFVRTLRLRLLDLLTPPPLPAATPGSSASGGAVTPALPHLLCRPFLIAHVFEPIKIFMSCQFRFVLSAYRGLNDCPIAKVWRSAVICFIEFC